MCLPYSVFYVLTVNRWMQCPRQGRDAGGWAVTWKGWKWSPGVSIFNNFPTRVDLSCSCCFCFAFCWHPAQDHVLPSPKLHFSSVTIHIPSETGKPICPFELFISSGDDSTFPYSCHSLVQEWWALSSTTANQNAQLCCQELLLEVSIWPSSHCNWSVASDYKRAVLNTKSICSWWEYLHWCR